MNLKSVSAVVSSSVQYTNRDGDLKTVFNHVIYGVSEDGRLYWRQSEEGSVWVLDDSEIGRENGGK